MGSLNADTKAKPTYEPVPSDTYTLRLVDITEKDGQYGPYWSWKFEMEDPPEAEGGVEWQKFQWLSTPNKTHPEAQFKQGTIYARLAAAALLGRDIADDEMIEGDEYVDLVGLKCRAAITRGPGKQGDIRNFITSLLPLQSKRRGNLAAVPNPAPAQPSLERELEESGTPEHDRSLGLDERKRAAVNSLAMSASDDSEYQAEFFKNRRPWAARTLVEKGQYVEHLEQLVEANDIPFDAPTAEELEAARQPVAAGKK